ncbi:MAG: COX15/CtaA family protein [Oleiphilaceae bacterium]|nr:COX15/CtaA family protein [Oleiphilaceae bacterium]
MKSTSTPDLVALGKLRLWAIVAFFFTIVVIVLGAWTRLVEAGLGCPDWPGCYGFLTVPSGAENVQLAESRFPDAPLDATKGWPEMIHRYAAGILGLIIFGMTVASYRLRQYGAPLKQTLFMSAFVCLQAAFGAWTVTLSLWPQVVAAHLLGGFTTLTLVFILALRLSPLKLAGLSATASEKLRRLRPLLYAALALVVMQIALGAWTASNYAALACPDFPTCQGEWWPEMDIAHGFDVTQSVGPNYMGGQLAHEGRIAIHQFHRVGAIVVTVVLLVLFALLFRQTRGSSLNRWVWVSLAALVLQMVLGVVNVLLHIPVAIAVAHNAGGALLLISLVNLAYRLHHLPANGDNGGLQRQEAGP